MWAHPPHELSFMNYGHIGLKKIVMEHPLIPLQQPASFLCHACLWRSMNARKCVSYKYNCCPFWVHQSCTPLPSTRKTYWSRSPSQSRSFSSGWVLHIPPFLWYLCQGSVYTDLGPQQCSLLISYSFQNCCVRRQTHKVGCKSSTYVSSVTLLDQLGRHQDENKDGPF